MTQYRLKKNLGFLRNKRNRANRFKPMQYVTDDVRRILSEIQIEYRQKSDQMTRFNQWRAVQQSLRFIIDTQMLSG